MNKTINRFPLVRPIPVPPEPVYRPRAGVRARQLSASRVAEPPQWATPTPPPDDTLTEMEGLARNPNATGAYAGSF